MKSYRIISIIFCLIVCGQVHAVDWMPDPHLERAVRERLDIPDTIPLIPDFMVDLRRLGVEGDIKNLKGLKYAVNLEELYVGKSRVSDITPLEGLENLRVLKLYNNRISDIRPLAGLVNLEVLQLQTNLISDITPLANLQNLRDLRLGGNHITDISPLAGLTGLQYLILEGNAISDFTPLVNLTHLQTLHIFPNPIPLGNQFAGTDVSHLKVVLSESICEIPRPAYTSSVAERLHTRDYPSVFLSHKRSNFNKDTESFDQLIHYDLSYKAEPLNPLTYVYTINSPFGGRVRISNLGMVHSAQLHRDVLRANPNMILIVSIGYVSGHDFGLFNDGFLPDDSPYWFRNPDGSIATRRWKVDEDGNKYYEPLLNFTHPDVIKMIIEQVVAVAKCGLYDGIHLDRWQELEGDFRGELSHLVTKEDELNARLQILQGIRANVPDDFLITVNSMQELPHSAQYINGVFIEAGAPDTIYTHKDLYHFENIIKWYESNLREPTFTLLWGQVDHKPPITQQTVRQFTTLSLTHSDGYVSLSSGHPDIRTYWYPFWDAPLGRPVSAKSELYDTREGLFLREFTNGWAVYNRSGKAQEIRLPSLATGWHSGYTGVTHEVPDLDGEIYIKRLGGEADLNNDGTVNILDLVMVANAFGEAEPDLNGDGIVNVLDLVRVASAF